MPRARHSAEIILGALGCSAVPKKPESTDLRFPGVEAQIQAWAAELGLNDDDTLLFVASGKQMHAIIRTFGSAPYFERGHAYTVICDKDAQGAWRAVMTSQPTRDELR